MTEYKTVDLGLSVKWADRNIGAESPEAFGDYFAWGETKPRGDDWDTKNPYDWAHAPFNNGREYFDKEYFINHKSEWLNKDGTLKPDYDAAHAIMGGSWRMPTSDEIQELIDGTTRSVEVLNGVKGMRFTSNANGNSIFIPFAGYRYDSDVDGVSLNGYAWSSSLYAGNADDSHGINFNGYGNAYVNNYDHYYGFAVRGVCE